MASLLKDVSGQKIEIYAYDVDADAPKTGDATNITAYISKDGGVPVAVGNTNPSEISSANKRGCYCFDLTQAETNASFIVLYASSTTADVSIDPVLIYTRTSSTIIQHAKSVWQLISKTHKYPDTLFLHTRNRTLFTTKQHIIQAAAIYYHTKERFLFYIKNHIVRTSAIIASFLDNLVTKVRIKAKVGKHV